MVNQGTLDEGDSRVPLGQKPITAVAASLKREAKSKSKINQKKPPLEFSFFDKNQKPDSPLKIGIGSLINKDVIQTFSKNQTLSGSLNDEYEYIIRFDYGRFVKSLGYHILFFLFGPIFGFALIFIEGYQFTNNIGFFGTRYRLLASQTMIQL